MNFGDAVRNGFNNYATFSGRAARSEFWYWTLFSFIVNICAAVIDSGLGIDVIGLVAALGLFLPGIAVAARRLHDIDRTGWWLLIAFTGIGIILLIIWDCFKGTTGANRFGADPLA